MSSKELSQSQKVMIHRHCRSIMSPQEAASSESCVTKRQIMCILRIPEARTLPEFEFWRGRGRHPQDIMRFRASQKPPSSESCVAKSLIICIFRITEAGGRPESKPRNKHKCCIYRISEPELTNVSRILAQEAHCLERLPSAPGIRADSQHGADRKSLFCLDGSSIF